MVDLMVQLLSLLVGQTADSWVDLMAEKRAGQKALQMVGCWVEMSASARLKDSLTVDCWGQH